MPIKQKSIIIGFALCLIASSAQALSLTTGFPTTPSIWIGSQAGNMFNVNVLSGDLLVTGMDIHTKLNPNSTNSNGTVEIYTRSGTYVDHEQNDAGWSLIDTVNFSTAGLGNPTFIDIADFILTGGITGFYVTLSQTDNTLMNYWFGDLGPSGIVSAANSDLEIHEGIGHALPVFSGDLFLKRAWTGTFYYEPAPGPIPEPSTFMLIGMGLLGLVGLRPKRRVR